MCLRLRVRLRLVQGGLGLDDRNQHATYNLDIQTDVERSLARRLYFYNRTLHRCGIFKCHCGKNWRLERCSVSGS
jgi:hypothetical protein